MNMNCEKRNQLAAFSESTASRPDLRQEPSKSMEVSEQRVPAANDSTTPVDWPEPVGRY